MTMLLESIPKSSDNQLTNILKQHGASQQQYYKPCDLTSHFDPCAWLFLGLERFRGYLVFGNSPPPEPTLASLGHPRPNFFISLMKSETIHFFKVPRAAFRHFVNTWHQQHLQRKQARTQTSILIINPHI